jgi:hypothetical protein
MTFLVLVLPVSVAAWLSPEHFSKQAFEQRGIATDATGLGERRPSPARPENTAKVETSQAAAAPAAPVSEASPAQNAPDQATSKVSLEPTATNPSGAQPVPAPAPAAANAPATSGTDAPIPEYLQKTPEGYIVTEVLDLLYAVQDSQLRKDFEGRTVQLFAQMMPISDKGGPGQAPQNRFKAVRMFMTCCAADARPVATFVEAATLPELPEMTWVRIVGKATFPMENGKRTAVVQATSVQQTKPPEESMLF